MIAYIAERKIEKVSWKVHLVENLSSLDSVESLGSGGLPCSEISQETLVTAAMTLET